MAVRGKILIIDDEEKLRKLLVRIIKLEGYDLDEAGTIEEGRKKLHRNEYHLVLCDVKLPDGNGVEFVPEFKKNNPLSEIVLLTAFGSIKDGVQAMRDGAFDYLTKGDDNEKIIPLVEKAVEKAKQALRLKQLLDKENNLHNFNNVIGESPAFKEALELSKKVATTDTSVLLIGETGSGKEVFANAIHQASTRSKENFIAVNCSAFSREILESEIFGHKAGSFTGATKDKKGLFEEADHGTIFLDEIGEMDVSLQAKLLRVLENGSFLRVGESKETRVDVRIIAATNRNLEEEAKKDHFRLDLYYRLSTFTIEIPSLQKRVEDIPLLANSFIDQFAVRLKRNRPKTDKEFMDALKKHPWQGNVRELRNIIERAMIISSGDSLTADDLPFGPSAHKGNTFNPESFALNDVEKMHIYKVLEHTGGNKTETARLLGIGLTTLYRKIEEYELQT